MQKGRLVREDGSRNATKKLPGKENQFVIFAQNGWGGNDKRQNLRENEKLMFIECPKTAESYYFAYLIYGNLIIQSYKSYEGHTFNYTNFLNEGTGSVAGRSLFVEGL